MDTKEKPSKETLEKWHQDPSNWKWGIIYFNKSDKRIFPPKRFAALGWTINFANPISISTCIILFGIIYLIISYTTN